MIYTSMSKILMWAVVLGVLLISVPAGEGDRGGWREMVEKAISNIDIACALGGTYLLPTERVLYLFFQSLPEGCLRLLSPPSWVPLFLPFIPAFVRNHYLPVTLFIIQQSYI